MLHVNKISHTDAYTEDWLKERIGKFTASEIGDLIGEKSHEGKFTKVAMTYIEGIAYEILTGKAARPEFSSANTDYGNALEPEAIEYFCKLTGKQVLRDTERMDTHRLIINDEMTACTPDALVAMTPIKSIFDESGFLLKVAPLEVKCPPVGHRFIKLFKCENPFDLKKTESNYFYQSLSQIIFMDSLLGYFAPYNPDFPIKMKVITFKKAELVDEIKKVNQTLEYAKLEVEKIVNLFKK